jgi:hypothetical protein
MNTIKPIYKRLGAITPAQWDTLSEKKIFFGRQSVGQNIVDGVRRVMEQNASIQLDIRETSDPGDFTKPLFAHSPIGRNMDPRSKIDDFKRILESGVGQVADFALFKFCFVDVDHRTDIASLFTAYEEAITSLKSRFHGLRIITFTIPLTNTPRGFKPMVKKLLGMMPSPKEDNKARNVFNSKLRERFGGSVFDLAVVEATLPDGRETTFKDDNEMYRALAPVYTDDGGHLNTLGQQVVAIELLLYLAFTGDT